MKFLDIKVLIYYPAVFSLFECISFREALVFIFGCFNEALQGAPESVVVSCDVELDIGMRPLSEGLLMEESKGQIEFFRAGRRCVIALPRPR